MCGKCLDLGEHLEHWGRADPGDEEGRRTWAGISLAALASNCLWLLCLLGTIAVNLTPEPTVGSLSIGLTQTDVQLKGPIVFLGLAGCPAYSFLLAGHALSGQDCLQVSGSLRRGCEVFGSRGHSHA